MAYNQINTFHLFAGAGGGILADILLGHYPIGACEIEEYPRNVLLQRQRDGILPEFPIWDNICTLDGKPWRGKVDIVCGGFPCQDISAAGKGAGIDGERSGLWGEMARIIREIRPRFVFVENSPMLTSRGLHRVLGDLAEMGYDAKWCVLGACDAGARHKRDRIWILATLADSDRRGSDEDRSTSELRTSGIEQSSENPWSAYQAKGGEVPQWWRIDPADVYNATGWGRGINGIGSEAEGSSLCGEAQHTGKCGSSTREASGSTESLVGRVAHGVANFVDFTGTPFTRRVPRVAHGIDNRVSRLKAIGNGQVSACAAIAFKLLMGEFD